MIPFVPWKPAADHAAADTAALLARVAGGETQALELIYRRESGAVYRYALALGGNAAWAADATHDAFVALAARPQGYDATLGTLGAYLAGIARNALRAQWRRAQGEQPWPDAGTEADADGDRAGDAADDDTPELRLDREQTTQALWAGLRALPPAMREVLVLVDLQERPYAEAAQVAGIALNTLRTRLHRARTRLAALLAPPAEETP